MTTRRPLTTRPAPLAQLPPPPSTDAPLPGTPAFAQALSDWAYGEVPPATADELALWRESYQAHVNRMPPLLRERTREVFRPFTYPQTIAQHAALAGVAAALLVMQLAPRLLGSADAALSWPLPLAVLGGFGGMYATREYLWSLWTAKFRSLQLTPPGRPRRRRRENRNGRQT